VESGKLKIIMSQPVAKIIKKLFLRPARIILSVLLFLALDSPLFSQDPRLTDSLRTLLKTARQDTSRANILYRLSRAYWGINNEMAMDLARQCLVLSEKAGYKKGEGNAYSSMGNVNGYEGNYPQALEFHKKALKIREETGDRKGVASSFNNIGTINLRQGDFPEALKNFSAALKIYEEIGDIKGPAGPLGNMGLIHSEQGNYPEALKDYFAALKIFEEIGDKSRIADTKNNIGLIYEKQGNFPEALKNHKVSLEINKETGDKRGIADSYNNLGNIYMDEGNYTEALQNYSDALKLYREIGNEYGLAYSYGNIGMICSNLGKYPEGLVNLFDALKILEKLGDKNGIASTYTNIGEIFILQKKYDEASRYLGKALPLSKETGSLENTSKTYRLMARLDSARGNFRQAWEHYKLFVTTRDSSVNQENTKKIVQQQMQYEFDKKESVTKAEQEKKDVITQREIQKQKWVRNGFIGGFAAVLLFAGVFLFQRVRISREKRKSDAEKKRSDELLLNILPYEVAQELKQTGSCQARTFSMVTVMFTDFKDFTAVSEKVSAELLVAEINICFSAFDNIVQKHGIEKIKTVGDAYLCVGGLPVLNYTHAVDVVKAALEIRSFILERKKEKIGRGEIPFELRIGIHTGPVVAGIVGVKKFQYDIWGDTVNLAARMESSGEAGQVNISGATHALIKDHFRCNYRGKITAKNKGEVDMYFVEEMM
jgi:adenylate cyclase